MSVENLCDTCEIRTLKDTFSVLLAMQAVRQINSFADPETMLQDDGEIIQACQLTSYTPQEAVAAIACARAFLGEACDTDGLV